MLFQHYTIKEVSDRLSVSHKTIRKLVSKGTIPAVKVAGIIRIPEDALTEYLDGVAIARSTKKPLAVKPTAHQSRTLKVGKVKDYFAT